MPRSVVRAAVCPADVVVGSNLLASRVSGERKRNIRKTAPDAPFYEYYQIDRGDQSDEIETEPTPSKRGKKEELKTQYEGSHSLFGVVWQIAAATGWNVKYILWGVNYQALRIMLADAPRYVKKKKKSKKTDLVGLFQSKAKK